MGICFHGSKCKYGMDCRYHHTDEEMQYFKKENRHVERGKGDESRRPRRSKMHRPKKCFFKYKCKEGRYCTFKHSTQEIQYFEDQV